MTKKSGQQKSRAVSFGVNSALLTLVVIALVGVVNFLGQRYTKKFDLTKNKVHTFSEQSENVIKNLKSEVIATLYGTPQSKERFKPLLDNYKSISTKFKVDFVNPDKDPIRTKAAGIKRMDTLVLETEGKKSTVEDLTEEKITNALIKLTKTTTQVICSVTGHGEPGFSAGSAEGFDAVKKGLESQSYQLREFALSSEPKIPADCGAVVILGPNRAFFPAEIKTLSDYLDQGGRLVVGLDAQITAQDAGAEFKALLKTWGADVKSGLLIDPVSRMMGVDASVPIIAEFNTGTAIGKDFKTQCYFPFSRPVEVVNPAPEGLNTQWVGKTTPKSWNETNMALISKGQVEYNPGADQQGPITIGVASSGKRKGTTPARDARLVVFGSAQFANNNYARFGGNQDLILNAISWVVEDESLISIRAKEDEEGRLELSQNQGIAVFWLSVILIPLLVTVSGIVIWVRRKKL